MVPSQDNMFDKALKIYLIWNDYCRHSAWSFLQLTNFLLNSYYYNMPARVSLYLLKGFLTFITIYYIRKSKETKFWICYSLNRTAYNCTRCHHSVSYLVMRLLASLSSHNGDVQTLSNNAVLARNGYYEGNECIPKITITWIRLNYLTCVALLFSLSLWIVDLLW